MKNKKFLIILICFVLLVLPLKQSLADWWNPLDWIKGALGWAIDSLKDQTVKGIAAIIYWITYGVHLLLFFINNSLLAPVIDYIAQLNPFKDVSPEAPSPIKVIWNILKNFAYILLVFSALAAAYEWLLGENANAKRLIFNIIIVALLINFTFVLVEEAFLVVDRFEKGITGGESKKTGTIIAASLWQKDPFNEIIRVTEQLVYEEDVVLKSLAQVIGYIFIIVFDMIILIILVITTVLFVTRYLMMIFLSGTSSIAIATLTFPEFKGVLGQVLATFRVWDTWLEHFIRWLLVVPIFIILVILGNILKENTLAQIQASDLIQFVLLLFMLGGWYLMSIRIANQISKGAANIGKVAATAAMLTVGGLAARGLMGITGHRVGGILTKSGDMLEERVGVGGILGWRSWINQKIAKPTREAGEKMIERRYKLDAEAAKSRIRTINEQLRKEPNPTRQADLTKQLTKLTETYKNVPYVLRQINEEIGKMSRISFEKVANNKEAMPLIAGSEAPQELRDKVMEQIDKLSKSALINIFGNKELLQTWLNLSPDVVNSFIEKLGKELNDANVLEQLSKPEIRELIPQLSENFRKTINRLSKGFIEAVMKKDVETISNAMASWSEDAWSKTVEIDQVLRGYGLDDTAIRSILSNSLLKMKDKGIAISGILREKEDGPFRTIIRRMNDDEFNQLISALDPQQQAALKAIRARRVIIP